MKCKKPLNCESYQLIKGRLTFHSIGSNAFSSMGYWGKNIFLSSDLSYAKPQNVFITSPMKLIVKARSGVKSRLSCISGEEGALSRALIIGDKSDTSTKLYNDFKASGTSHLMAVSGLHLSAISGFVLFILKKLKAKDKLTFALTLGVIAYYAALCGFSKSVLRAGIMMSVLTLGKLFGRHSDSLNSLGLAAFIICINPFAVCDAGAILSILCVLSLCTAYPVFERRINKLKLFKSIRLNDAAAYILKAVAASFCIMAYSLCAMFIFFGYISVVGLFASVFMIPLGSFATVLAFITSIAIRMKIGVPFIYLSTLTNKLIIAFVEHMASLRFAVINFENYFGFIIAAILIIFAFCFIIGKKHIKKAAVISLVIAFAALISSAVINNSCAYVYVTENGAAAICKNKSAVVYGIENKSDLYSIEKFLGSRNEKVEAVFADKENRYSALAAKDFNCQSAFYHSCKKNFANGVKVSCTLSGSAYDFKADINGFVFSTSNVSEPENDINVIKNICIDKNGTVDLSQGDIIYRISENNYRARRVNIWQE